MSLFEPSTWAEVEEALLSGRASATSSSKFVESVRTFTDAPERFSFHSKSTQPFEVYTSSTGFSTSDKEESNPANEAVQEKEQNHARSPPPGIKRTNGQFEDLLGMGKVDIEAESFVQGHVATTSLDDVNVAAIPTSMRNIINSNINPSSENFDAEAYLAKIHQESTLEDLLRGQEALAKLKDNHRKEAEQFRKDHYINAALVEAAFQKAKRSAAQHPRRKDVPKLRNPAEVFSNAEALIKSRYAEVIEREATLARLRRTLGVYTRYQWVFSLGQRLRSSATGGPNVIEDVIREYQRGVKWIEAQDDDNLSSIQTDINDGFEFLVDSIFKQLSTKTRSQQQTSRLVTILANVKKDELLIKALSIRTQDAVDELQRLQGVFEVPPDSGFSVEIVQREAVELTSRASSIFVEGLTNIWQLGKTLRSQEKWHEAVDKNIHRCCDAYCGVIRNAFVDNSAPLSQDAVRELGSVQMKAKDDLQVPLSCLAPLTELTKEIILQFVRTVCELVQKTVDDLVAECTQSHGKIGRKIGGRLAEILTQALDETEESSAHKHEIFEATQKEESAPSENESKKELEVSVDTTGNKASGVTNVAVTCAQAPGNLAQRVHELLPREALESESLALQLSAFCIELNSTALDLVRRRIGPSSGFDTGAVGTYIAESEEILRRILTKTTTRYVSMVAAPLQSLVSGLISFPGEELEESVNRSVQIKIAGVSKSANEVALQLALTTITIRQKTQNKTLISAILLSLIQDIGNTLVEVLSTDKLIYHRAAQLWVDVTYMQDTITRGADVETAGLQKALDGYAKVKERAVQAVLADGYSFNLADMDVLKESVIATGVAQSQMVQDCFRETWGLLQEEQHNSEN